MNRAGYFLDTYAMMEFTGGNTRYRKYFESTPLFTSFLNLTELYYHALRDGGEESAQRLYLAFRRFAIELKEDDIFSGMRFRIRMKASGRGISHVDALGYAMAGRTGSLFLTGDAAFRGVPNVEFVR